MCLFSPVGFLIVIQPTLAEKAMNKLVAERWLKRVGHEGRLELGVRGYLDLGTYLGQQFEEDLPKCFLCQKQVVKVRGDENCACR